MGRRRSSIAEDIIEIGAMLPWWLGALLAGALYVVLHHFAQIDPGIPRQGDFSPITRTAFKGFSEIAQYVLPVLLLLGSAISLVKRLRRASVYNSVAGSGGFARGRSRDKLDTLTWRQFEDLVHEHFRRNGYSVVETAQGPDGGIDLKLTTNGRTATVQCKHWCKKKVDVRIVREQLGVMTASNATECFVVTSGDFTKEARTFSKGQPITLIDGKALRRSLGIFAWDHVEEQAQRAEQISCPSCGSRMIIRTARRGPHAGNSFWGCSEFPRCRGTRQVA